MFSLKCTTIRRAAIHDILLMLLCSRHIPLLMEIFQCATQRCIKECHTRISIDNCEITHKVASAYKQRLGHKRPCIQSHCDKAQKLKEKLRDKMPIVLFFFFSPLFCYSFSFFFCWQVKFVGTQNWPGTSPTGLKQSSGSNLKPKLAPDLHFSSFLFLFPPP